MVVLPVLKSNSTPWRPALSGWDLYMENSGTGLAGDNCSYLFIVDVSFCFWSLRSILHFFICFYFMGTPGQNKINKSDL